MRRAGALIFLCFLVLCLSVCGCGRRGTAWYRVFAAPFEAELCGEMNGLSFEARFCRGEEATTVTFYAPATLAGTTLTRAADGRVTMTAGGVTTEVTGFDDLFLLFPTADTTKKAAVTDEGHTRVEGDGFFAEFLPDGTPYRVGCGGVTATVVRFAPQGSSNNLPSYGVAP